MHTRNIKNKGRLRRFIKYKLLLDESLPPRRNYPNLNRQYSVKDVAHDLMLSGISDQSLYELAKKDSRIVVVFNTKDFKPMITPNKPSVISLSTNLTNKEADLKICKALKEISPVQAKGNLISISKSGITIKIPEN